MFDEPSKINRDPYGSWIMKVKIKDKDELNKLMKPEEASGFYSSKIK
ncbi:MAG: hypothetical protein QXR60_03720 [Candidatus Nanoarchaeia archaeon]